ncbi:MAG: hypothetical protein OIN66_08815 [Candidatus Methanoperedens sp.]|nr:hypothetical protein [Candidatus Methanoperedens sp.]
MSKILIGWLKMGIETLEPLELEDYLRKAQEEKREIEKRSHNYVICDLRINEGQNYIFGWLLKLSPHTKEQYFDSDQWKRKEEELKGKHVKMGSRFIIFNNELIIFEDNYPYLSYNTFKNVLEDILINVSDNAIRHFDIILKRDVQEIRQFLENVDRVTKITFKNIKIPNPIDINKPNIRKAKEFIIEQKIKELEFGNKDGINIEGSITQGGLEYAEEGWWDAKLYAEQDQRKRVFETRKKILYRMIEVIDDEDFIAKSREIKEEQG